MQPQKLIEPLPQGHFPTRSSRLPGWNPNRPLITPSDFRFCSELLDISSGNFPASSTNAEPLATPSAYEYAKHRALAGNEFFAPHQDTVEVTREMGRRLLSYTCPHDISIADWESMSFTERDDHFWHKNYPGIFNMQQEPLQPYPHKWDRLPIVNPNRHVSGDTIAAADWAVMTDEQKNAYIDEFVDNHKSIMYDLRGLRTRVNTEEQGSESRQEASTRDEVFTHDEASSRLCPVNGTLYNGEKLPSITEIINNPLHPHFTEHRRG